MRPRTKIAAAASIVGLLASGAGATPKPKPLTRSLFVPVTFLLCEHLEAVAIYQDEKVVAVEMPAERIFQFTYYPKLEQLLPEAVQIRVEGRYVDDGEPFVARLAVTAGGLHTASHHRSLGTRNALERQRHKRDARLEAREIRLVCPRQCSRSKSVASLDDGPQRSVEEP